MNKLLILVFLFSLGIHSQNLAQKELDKKTHNKIQKLCKSGDFYVTNGQFEKALVKYKKAFYLLPEPKSDWDAGTWIWVAIGDTNFLRGNYNESVKNFYTVLKYPNALGNPFIHLRLGQPLLEVGKKKKAANELTKAYALEGEDIFKDENIKYLHFLKTQIEINN